MTPLMRFVDLQNHSLVGEARFGGEGKFGGVFASGEFVGDSSWVNLGRNV